MSDEFKQETFDDLEWGGAPAEETVAEVTPEIVVEQAPVIEPAAEETAEEAAVEIAAKIPTEPAAAPASDADSEGVPRPAAAPAVEDEPELADWERDLRELERVEKQERLAQDRRRERWHALAAERRRKQRRKTILAILCLAAIAAAAVFIVKLARQDRKPPVFEMAENFEVGVGETVTYRQHVSVRDDRGEVELEVDASKVDVNTPGTYDVVYTATDAAGNTAQKTLQVTVVDRTISAEEPNLETKVNARVDEILGEILTDDMDTQDKVITIVYYLMSHITYVSGPDREDWVEAAWEGLDKGSGDCTVYQALTKAFLTRAGIKNMDINHYIVPGRVLENEMEEPANHAWNLVDIGDGHGWYHVDSCPSAYIMPPGVLWTTAQLEDFMDAAGIDRYDYDESEYPEVP